MMLDHYQKTKNMLVSYSRKRLGSSEFCRDYSVPFLEVYDGGARRPTKKAEDLIARLKEHMGPAVPSVGGCCDGSSPMCFPAAEFRTGPSDVLLGEIAAVPFYWPPPNSNIGRTRN